MSENALHFCFDHALENVHLKFYGYIHNYPANFFRFIYDNLIHSLQGHINVHFSKLKEFDQDKSDQINEILWKKIGNPKNDRNNGNCILYKFCLI